MRKTAAALVLIGPLVHGTLARETRSASVPLCPGLTIVTAINEPAGDYESIKTIESIAGNQVSMTYSTEAPAPDGGVRRVRRSRTILVDDLRSATRYARNFGEGIPTLLPGTTALGTSTVVLNSLRSRGEAELALPDDGLLASFERAAGGAVTAESITFASGTIRRVGTMRVPVLVNDRRVDLPAMQARGEFFGTSAEFAFLDDPDNPIALRYAVPRGEFSDLLGTMAVLLGDSQETAPEDTRDVLQVVKITHGCGQASRGGAGSERRDAPAAPGQAADRAQALEQALQESGRVEVYSIFFSFNSDAIREESDQTIAEIAAVLARHGDWKLSIEGHTDSIGSDQDNRALSQRRAAAVKDALVTRHGIDPGRLTTAGFGESRPRDTNDTLEGRAGNRRVELVRQ